MKKELIQQILDALRLNPELPEKDVLKMMAASGEYTDVEAEYTLNVFYSALYRHMIVVTPTFVAMQDKILTQDNIDIDMLDNIIGQEVHILTRKKELEDDIKKVETEPDMILEPNTHKTERLDYLHKELEMVLSGNY